MSDTDDLVMREVSVIARVEGFRRCGMVHGTAEVSHAPGTFTQQQLDRLLAEPQLIVVVEDETETAAQRRVREKADKAGA
jgi:hypothetical protein